MATAIQPAGDEPAGRAGRNRLYTPGGLWLVQDAATDTVRVGLTDAMRRAAGPVLYVELPERGMSIDAGDELANVETAEADLSLPSPVAGMVMAINTALLETPELIDQDPFHAGWLVDLRPAAWPVTGLLDERALAALTGD